MFGYTQAECVGRTVDDIVHPEDRAAVLQAFAALRRGEIETARAERRYLRKDGGVYIYMLPSSQKMPVSKP